MRTAVGALIVYRLGISGESAPPFPSPRDIIAGSMAAGVVAILLAAVQGSIQRDKEASPGAGPS